ncbi:MAG: DUF3332 domain-containing protein [Treponema sp.]|nr:DUF3332 domain-containing protein [Treponema sp.]
MGIKKWFRCVALALAVFAGGMTVTGCAGQFAAFNRSQAFLGNLGGRWIGAVVTWIVGFPIVYPIALFADAVIFNLIEFWTGNNLIAAGGSFEQTDEIGNRIYVAVNDDGTLSVNVTKVTGETSDYLFEREGDKFKIFGTDGIHLSSFTVTNGESL